VRWMVEPGNSSGAAGNAELHQISQLVKIGSQKESTTKYSAVNHGTYVCHPRVIVGNGKRYFQAVKAAADHLLDAT
jgi:hypothetical protein